MEALQETMRDDVQDDLRPEYDIHALRVRKVGAGRTAGTLVVTLAPDVAAVFASEQAVNDALRGLMQSAQDNAPEVIAAKE